MKNELIRDIMDWFRIARDAAILKEDDEVAMKLSDMILLAAVHTDERGLLTLFDNAVEDIAGVGYLRREVSRIRPLLLRLELLSA